MSRLDEMDEYDGMFGRRLVDEDFLAAGYSPQEVQAYRGSFTAPTLTPQARADMQSQYGDFETPDYTLRERGANRIQDTLSARGITADVEEALFRSLLPSEWDRVLVGPQ